MLREVRISDVGVISAACLELGPGFTAITGETGAGKTMVLTGLAMLRGAKVPNALVRAGATAAAAEGLIDVVPGTPAYDRAVDAGAVIEDEQLLVARTVSAAGRSRAVLGGRGVPAALVAEVIDELVAVHGQNDQLRLGRSQLGLLDRWAGPAVSGPLARYRELYAELTGLHREIEALQAAADDRERRADLLRYGLDEIAKVGPAPGEDLELAARSARLGHAELLDEAVRGAAGALAADAEYGDEIDVLGLLARARRLLDGVREHDPGALDGLFRSLGEAAAIASDVAGELASYAAGLEADPALLGQIENRRAELIGLARKYGGSVDAALSWSAAAIAELSSLEHAESDIAAKQDRMGRLRGQLEPLARELHDARVAAAERFGALVETELAALAMPKATFRMAVSVHPLPGGLAFELDGSAGTWAFGPRGCDDAQLLLAANPGAPQRPVAQAASGGELSRVMLAIQVVAAGADPVPTMVFDEIDAGVGGAAAVEVGRRLARLAQSCQVIVVTHLAQVCAFADHHFVVAKTDDGAVTEASVQPVTGSAREQEIARMLSGDPHSEVALAHARELLAGRAFTRRI
ncbi:MAG: DNA repair protein RecN [Candidatus Nanopelagicales bacterium]